MSERGEGCNDNSSKHTDSIITNDRAEFPRHTKVCSHFIIYCLSQKPCWKGSNWQTCRVKRTTLFAGFPQINTVFDWNVASYPPPTVISRPSPPVPVLFRTAKRGNTQPSNCHDYWSLKGENIKLWRSTVVMNVDTWHSKQARRTLYISPSICEPSTVDSDRRLASWGNS